MPCFLSRRHTIRLAHRMEHVGKRVSVEWQTGRKSFEFFDGEIIDYEVHSGQHSVRFFADDTVCGYNLQEMESRGWLRWPTQRREAESAPATRGETDHASPATEVTLERGAVEHTPPAAAAAEQTAASVAAILPQSLGVDNDDWLDYALDEREHAALVRSMRKLSGAQVAAFARHAKHPYPSSKVTIDGFEFRSCSSASVKFTLTDAEIAARVQAHGRAGAVAATQPRIGGMYARRNTEEFFSREVRARLAAEALRQAEEEGLRLAPAPLVWLGERLQGSGYKGVKSMRSPGMPNRCLPYQARIDGRRSLGCFETAEEAALARARYVKQTGHLECSFPCNKCGGRKSAKVQSCARCGTGGRTGGAPAAIRI